MTGDITKQQAIGCFNYLNGRTVEDKMSLLKSIAIDNTPESAVSRQNMAQVLCEGRVGTLFIENLRRELTPEGEAELNGCLEVMQLNIPKKPSAAQAGVAAGHRRNNPSFSPDADSPWFQKFSEDLQAASGGKAGGHSRHSSLDFGAGGDWHQKVTNLPVTLEEILLSDREENNQNPGKGSSR